LEPVVREALASLGASVTVPEQAGLEDGRLVDSAGRAAMLEIKGKTGALGVEDVRQLDGWIRNAMADEGWEGKGVIVANLKLSEPPDTRDEVVAPNALTFAKRVEIGILTTPQLYEALRRDQEGTLDRHEFWEAVFSANGLVGLPSVSASRAFSGG
jgi:hypothetical protein